MHRRRNRLAAVISAAVALLVGAAATLLATLAATPANPAGTGTGTGYLRTSGNRIIDSTGATVRLTGINWFGMETDNHIFHGLWANAPATWRGQIDRMASLGFNTIRVPYTGDSLRPGAAATGINDFTDPDLVGNSPLQILDKAVQYAGSKGMRIILDRHRPTAAGQTPLWYTASVSEASIIADWQMLAQRYAGNIAVIGADLFNEPHAEDTDPNGTGACWAACPQARDWRLAAERIGTATGSWQGGFQAKLVIGNTGTSPWNNWTVTWTMPSVVTLNNGWPGPVTQSGTTWTARAPDYARNLAPGATFEIGFTANGPSSPGASNFRCS